MLRQKLGDAQLVLSTEHQCAQHRRRRDERRAIGDQLISDAQSRRIFEAVKKHQPNCLINSRLGNGAYDYVSLGDNEIPDEIPTDLGEYHDNDIGGFKPSPYGLYESAATLNDTWGFSAYDQNWKSPDTILEYRRRLKKLGINYLLNVGPDPLGRIPAPSVDILREVARRMGE